jgi:DNA invertase Pin-like site-specific DNA recombinase
VYHAIRQTQAIYDRPVTGDYLTGSHANLQRGDFNGCRGKGYFLIRVFSDVSRRWDATRPDFQAMVHFIKENLRAGDTIMVWCADRIAGSASTCAALEPLLDQGGIIGSIPLSAGGILWARSLTAGA